MAIKTRVGVGAQNKPQMPKMPEVNVDFMKVWAKVSEHIPDILKHPGQLLTLILKYINLGFA